MADNSHLKDNAVILHHPDAVDISREKLMGRHAAGAGFLNADRDGLGLVEARHHHADFG